MLSGILLFALGSTTCGSASSMNMLIFGRGSSYIPFKEPVCMSNSCPIVVQGLGAGKISSMMQIILSDLVTLRERGTFTGLMALCVVLSLLCLENCRLPLSIALGPLVVVSVQSLEVHWQRSGNGMSTVSEPTFASSPLNLSYCFLQEMAFLYV
jgi:MFS family permease